MVFFVVSRNQLFRDKGCRWELVEIAIQAGAVPICSMRRLRPSSTSTSTQFVAFSFHSNDVLLVFHTRAQHVSGIEWDSIFGEANPADSSVGSWHLPLALSPSTRALPHTAALTIITGINELPPAPGEFGNMEEQAPGVLVTVRSLRIDGDESP